MPLFIFAIIFVVFLQFTLVDAALAPFFLRLPVLKHYRDFDLPQVRQGLSFRAYVRACCQRSHCYHQAPA